eukprot:COSAG05_NODE_4525_length_1478_cov_1.819434_1_plen_174_part_00
MTIHTCAYSVGRSRILQDQVGCARGWVAIARRSCERPKLSCHRTQRLRMLQSPPNEAAWSVALLAASSSCSLAPACTARLISAPVESDRRSSDCSDDPRALAITAAQLLAARMRPLCPQSGVATRHRALLCTPLPRALVPSAGVAQRRQGSAAQPPRSAGCMRDATVSTVAGE